MSTVSSKSPKVQYSVQRELSDGSLNRISVRVPYFSKDDIHVYVSDIEIKDTTVEGSKYTWRWDGDYIAITPNVDQGIEVLVRRITPIDEAIHIFDGRSEFDDQSMDENFQQLIYIAQEYSEGSGIKDVFSDINMHGYKIKNVGWATDDDDVVTYGQYKKDSEGAKVARDEANAIKAATEELKNNAEGSATLSKAWATKLTDKVQGEDYSSKYYANKSAQSAQQANSEAERAKNYADIASAGQYQSDWEQSDPTAKDYIKNKPDVHALEERLDVAENTLKDKSDQSYVDSLCKHVIATGSNTARPLPVRFADIVNVKDFGANGDGITDDSMAFSKAIAKSKTVFVPEGVYAVSSTSDFVSHCYGFGSLKYPNGLVTSVRFLAEDKALKQFYNCDLKGFRTNVVAQSMSILDGFVFISQNTDPSDDAFGKSSKVRITSYRHPADMEAPKSLDDVGNQVDAYASVELTGLGHGEGCKAYKEGSKTFLITSIGVDDSYNTLGGYCKVEWKGSATTQADITRYEGIRGIKRAHVSMSNDGRYVLFVQGDLTIRVFDREALEKNPTGVDPISIIRYKNNVNSRSGIASDGKYVYILESGYGTNVPQYISVYSISGEFVNTFPVNLASSIFKSEIESRTPSGKIVFAIEAEGLDIVDDKLYSVVKLNTGEYTAENACTYNGATYVAITDSTGKFVDNNKYWMRVNVDLGAQPWDSNTKYTASKNVTFHKFVVYLASASHGGSSYAVSYKNFTDISKPTFSKPNTPEVSIGAEYSSGLEAKFATFQNGVFACETLTGTKGTIKVYDGSVQVSGNSADGKHYCTLKLTREDADPDPSTILFYAPNQENSEANSRVALMSLQAGAMFYTPNIRPRFDNACDLGLARARWKTIFAADGTINTSDRRAKTDISKPSEALMRAWGKVSFKVFRFKEAVENKCNNARYHVGVIAQDVKEAFESEGLDAFSYGLLCYDKWDAEYDYEVVEDQPAVLDSEGKTVAPAMSHVESKLITPAGDCYGIRYEEALALECAYQRWRLDRIEKTLNASPHLARVGI